MKIAVVHEWLINFAGSEKVLAEILDIWPNADLFAVVDFLTDKDRQKIGGKFATTSFIQKLPNAKKLYQKYLPLMPLAMEQLDLTGYDLIISSSHAVAKGVICGPDQAHVSYVHSPIRYAWDFQHQYLRDAGIERGFKSFLARSLLHYMRIWDQRTANGVDLFISNSHFIGRRITKAYRRDALVIYPPVDTSAFSIGTEKKDFYLTASRMVPYKKIPMIVEAFNEMPDKNLVVIGDGPDLEKVKKIARSNVSLLGYQNNKSLISHMQAAKAFVFAAEEDFGITPVEAQACGTPVIAYGKGGSLETVRGMEKADPTGVFYYEQTHNALQHAVNIFEKNIDKFTSTACRSNSENFSTLEFKNKFKDAVEKFYKEFCENN